MPLNRITYWKYPHNVVLTGGDGTGRPRRKLNENRRTLTRPSVAIGCATLL